MHQIPWVVCIPTFKRVQHGALSSLSTGQLAFALQVVAEVYAAQDVVVKPHILLSLVLYKIVDPAQVGVLCLNPSSSSLCPEDSNCHVSQAICQVFDNVDNDPSF